MAEPRRKRDGSFDLRFVRGRVAQREKDRADAEWRDKSSRLGCGCGLIGGVIFIIAYLIEKIFF